MERTVVTAKTMKLGGVDCQFEKMSDGSTRISGYSGNPDELFKRAGFGHSYDAISDEFTFNYGMQVHRGSSGSIEFIDRAYTDEHDSCKGFQRNGAGNVKNDFRPDDEEYKQIVALMPKAFPQTALKVFQTVSVDSSVDSHNEHFSLKAGRKIAKWGYDNPVMDDHNYWSASGVHGKIFDGAVQKMENGAFDVSHKFFMLDTPEYTGIIQGYETGLNNKLSIGVRIKRADYLCDICNRAMFTMDEKFNYDWCGHLPGMVLKDGRVVTCTIDDIQRFLELSRVTVPAFKNAAVRKGGPTQVNMAETVKLMSAFAVDEARNSNVARISSVPNTESADTANKGETQMTEKQDAAAQQSTEKKDEAAKQDQAASATGTPDTAVEKKEEAATKLAEIAETCSKAVQSAEAALNSAKALTGVVEKLAEKVDSIAKSSEASKAELSAKDAQLEKNVAEGRELLKNIGEAHLALQKSIGVAVSKSNEDIARMQANSKNLQHRQDVEKSKGDGTAFYADVQSRF